MRTFAVVLCFTLSLGCAQFNASVRPGSGNIVPSRQLIAGTTLACAGASQRSAIGWASASLLGSVASSLFLSLATSNPQDAVGLNIGALLSSGLSLVSAFGAGIAFGNSVAYTERAGQVLAGLSDQGCSDGPVVRDVATPEIPLETRPVRRVASPPPTQAQPTGRCTAADVEERRKAGMSESAIQSACNGT